MKNRKKKDFCSRHKRQNIHSTAKALTYQNEQKAKKFKMAKIYPQTLQIKLNAMLKHIKGKEIYL